MSTQARCCTRYFQYQNIPCETLGLLEQMFVHDGYHIEKLNIQDDPMPTSAVGYDAIVILGGPMAVYDNFPYLQREQELIRDAMKNDTPVLGLCLGSQLIAQGPEEGASTRPRRKR